jgi:ribosomal-protein-alanine N-acetyltransferase
MELETQHLLIRPFTLLDISDVYLNALNEDIIIGLTEARHKKWDIEKVKHFIINSNLDNSLLLAVILKQNNKPIGNIRLFNINNNNHNNAELSFLFYDKNEWGKGYATESLRIVINYAFDNLQLHRIFADYYSINTGSAKVFKKLDFQIEGIFVDHFKNENNQYIDSIRVAKLKIKK